MNIILSDLRALDGVLELAPAAGSAHPALSWGDHFFYYAPDGHVPTTRQPYATIVTKDYPDDTASRLDDPGRWRLNIHVGPQRFTEVLGYPPAATDAEAIDFGAEDAFLPHPLYARQGWLAVVNPGPVTRARIRGLLREAHEADRARVERR